MMLKFNKIVESTLNEASPADQLRKQHKFGNHSVEGDANGSPDINLYSVKIMPHIVSVKKAKYYLKNLQKTAKDLERAIAFAIKQEPTYKKLAKEIKKK